MVNTEAGAAPGQLPGRLSEGQVDKTVCGVGVAVVVDVVVGRRRGGDDLGLTAAVLGFAGAANADIGHHDWVYDIQQHATVGAVTPIFGDGR